MPDSLIMLPAATSCYNCLDNSIGFRRLGTGIRKTESVNGRVELPAFVAEAVASAE
jgi:hypothetical protein